MTLLKLSGVLLCSMLFSAPASAFQGICCNNGKIRKIAMQYTGGDCSASFHSQPPGKVNCAGDTFQLPEVHVLATDKVDPNDPQARVWFDGNVLLGQSIILDAANEGLTKLSSKSFLHITDIAGVPLMEIEFHTSCSVPLNPMDQFGAFLVMECLGENDPGPTTCCDNGQLTELTFAYTGSDCSPSTHSQGSAASCSGDTLNEMLVQVLATDNPDPGALGAKVYFDGEARVNTNFTMTAANAGESVMNGTIWVHITDIYVGGPLMTVSFDASCSSTLEHGDQFGALLLLSCIAVNDPEPGSCCAAGKVNELSLTYTGEGCSATHHSQPSNKVHCSGDPAMEPRVRIVMTDKPNPDDHHAKVWFDGIVDLGETFYPAAANAGKTKFKSKSFTHIYDLGGALLQSIEFHTSCSVPLNAGDQFGSLKLVGCRQESDPPVGTPFCMSSETQACPCGNPDPSGGCVNSAGTGASMYTLGTASVLLDDLKIVATGLPPGRPSLIFTGIGTTLNVLGDGVRCVSGGGLKMFRYFPRAADAAGSYSVGPGLVADSVVRFSQAHGNFDPGETWGFQTWYRDSSGPCGNGSNLSSAISVTFTP